MDKVKLIAKQQWSIELKERANEVIPDLDLDDLKELIALINWAREEATIDKCEACNKINSEDAWDYISDNPPDWEEDMR